MSRHHSGASRRSTDTSSDSGSEYSDYSGSDSRCSVTVRQVVLGTFLLAGYIAACVWAAKVSIKANLDIAHKYNEEPSPIIAGMSGTVVVTNALCLLVNAAYILSKIKSKFDKCRQTADTPMNQERLLEAGHANSPRHIDRDLALSAEMRHLGSGGSLHAREWADDDDDFAAPQKRRALINSKERDKAVLSVAQLLVTAGAAVLTQLDMKNLVHQTENPGHFIFNDGLFTLITGAIAVVGLVCWISKSLLCERSKSTSDSSADMFVPSPR